MQIAITGTHGIGKTTLVNDLVETRTEFSAVPEPFLVFQNDAALVDGPNTDDFEEQLNQSCNLILELSTEENLVFDRCPLDFLAYLDVVSEMEGFEWSPSGKLLALIERAMEALDLVIFIPLLDDDEIGGTIEYPKLRRQVDVRLKSILRDDDLCLFENGPRTLEIFGRRERRVAGALAGLTMGS